MTSIQGIQGVSASYATPKAQAAAPKGEFGETAQTERNEAVSGTQEISEAAAKTPTTVGGRFSTTA